MRDYNLKLSPFHTLDVLSCHIKKCVNDHMRFEFCGLIQPEDEENFLKAGLEDIAVELSMVGDDGSEYLSKTKNQLLSLIEADALCLEVDSRDVYEIGDSFPFQGQTYYIYEIESVLDGRELIHHYKLRSKAALQTIKQFNERMIGASLEATISGVSNDTVRVNIASDGIQSNRKWFLYSTVYSSPDGTGWYCMPEEGDSVRLYLPNEKEKDGYIISAVHVPIDGEARSIPDNKSLKSKYGKEVLFTPSLLRLTNNNGMSVEISDEDGITISSDKAVTIEAKEGVQIASMEQSIEVVAPESIVLKQGDTTLTMEDDIHLDGAQVHME